MTDTLHVCAAATTRRSRPSSLVRTVIATPERSTRKELEMKVRIILRTFAALALLVRVVAQARPDEPLGGRPPANATQIHAIMAGGVALNRLYHLGTYKP